MPIVPHIGRRTWRIRLLIGGMYAVLVLGGITMVYPFLLMVKVSVSSKMDQDDYTPYPAFLINENVLMAKYLNERFSYWTPPLQLRYKHDYRIWKELVTPLAQHEYKLSDPVQRQAIRAAARDLHHALHANLGSVAEKVITDAVSLLHRHLERLQKSHHDFFDPQLYLFFQRRIVDVVKKKRLEEEWLTPPRHATKPSQTWQKDIARRIAALEKLRVLKYDVTHPDVHHDIEKMAEDWIAFRRTLPPQLLMTNFLNYSISGKHDRGFIQFVQRKYHGDLAEVNRQYEEGHRSFRHIRPPRRGDRMQPEDVTNQKDKDWESYNQTLDAGQFTARYYDGHEASWGAYFADQVKAWAMHYRQDLADKHALRFEGEYCVEAMNAILDTAYPYDSKYDIPPPTSAELNHVVSVEKDGKIIAARPILAIWSEFMQGQREQLRFIRVLASQADFTTFLKRRYGTVEALNKAHAKGRSEPIVFYHTFEEYELSAYRPLTRLAARQDWDAFVRHLDVTQLEFVSYEKRYRAFLRDRYQDIAVLNRRYRTVQFASFEDVYAPYAEYDLHDFQRNRQGMVWHFLTANYGYVIDRVFLNGRALLNTIVLLALAIVTALTVNPLAAYALSRFRLSYAHKVLVFFLASMAFPAEVAMIPNFLLIKELGLLNTYAALILPGMANGYHIFMLKGFFDSIPLSLYEAGEIDGANNVQMFFHITLPLARPVLAVIALFTFMVTYAGFMWALLICPAESKWTIMVFITQFAQIHQAYETMAALVIAAMPPLLVFVFCQRIIMRGIVVPSMK